MTKYIFLDVDGTLFSSQIARIPESAERALKSARAMGHKIYLCTGRSLSEGSSYLNYDVDGFVFGAGGNVYAEGECIVNTPMKTEEVTMLKKIIDDLGGGYSLEGEAGTYCNPRGYEALLWYFSGGSDDREVCVKNLEKVCTYTEEHGCELDDRIYKMCCFAPDWEPIYPELERRLPEPYILTKAMELKDDHFCIGEVTDRNISKASGVRAVLAYYGADLKDAYGFGDSDNDIPMFTACGTGIAMGNSTPATKEAADYITDHILEDGLAKAFVHFGLASEDVLKK